MKWRDCPPDVIPAWIADLDVRPAEAVRRALHRAVDAGDTGYPSRSNRDLPEVLASWLDARFGWHPDPNNIVLAADAVVGVALAIEALCTSDPVIVPIPSYPPFLDAVPRTGRQLIPVPCQRDEGRASLDFEAMDKGLAAGARTILLTNPHNPLGRCWTSSELMNLKEVADGHGARVISDEIHAPLVLPGARHVPYAQIDPERHITVISASKAWNLPGLKCAQIIVGEAADARALGALPRAANRGVSSLGIAASIAAYRDASEWLDGLVSHIAARREQFGRLMTEMLPHLTWEPLEATYLAWVDARATGLADPSATALERGRVLLDPGSTFGPAGVPLVSGRTAPRYDGFARVNIGTSAERLGRIVAGLARAWSPQR